MLKKLIAGTLVAGFALTGGLGVAALKTYLLAGMTEFLL